MRKRIKKIYRDEKQQAFSITPSGPLHRFINHAQDKISANITLL